MEFSDSVKYTNIVYSNKNICISFYKDNYSLDNCNNNKSDLSFDSKNNCKMYYSKGYNSFIFDCGLNNINVVKMKEFSFNKVKFSYKKSDYELINSSTFTTMDGLQKISFKFVDDKNIKFSKYLDNNLVDEEICPYTYNSESMGLECKKFYGYSAFIIDKYDKNTVTINNRNNKIVFVKGE